STRDRILSSTRTVGRLAGIPVVAQTVNAVNKSRLGRKLLEKSLGVHAEATVPHYHARSARARLKQKVAGPSVAKQVDPGSKVLVFATCYGDRNAPTLVEDLVAVLEHNGVEV